MNLIKRLFARKTYRIVDRGFIDHYYTGYYMASRPSLTVEVENAAKFSDKENAEEICKRVIISMKAQDERVGRIPHPSEYNLIVESC